MKHQAKAWGVMVAALVLGGCERLAPPPSHDQGEAQPTAKAKANAEPERAEVAEPIRSTPADAPPSRFPAPARLVAIGDVHGDLAATKAALRMAGAIDEHDEWIGGDLVVVQTGDQLDRGDDEQAILELLERLQAEAKAAGGALHVLNGNHEYMNALGDLRYVTPGGFADFADAPGTEINDPELERALADVPEQVRPRLAAFLPGQPWARKLAERPMILIVGESVFVHGGVLPKWAEVGPEAINSEARAYLLGEREQPPEAMVDQDGPVWTRAYSDQPDAEDCAMLERSLELLGAERMIVGHTVHTEGVQSACDGKVWMIDVGMAAHYGGPIQVLEIRGDQVRVLE